MCDIWLVDLSPGLKKDFTAVATPYPKWIPSYPIPSSAWYLEFFATFCLVQWLAVFLHNFFFIFLISCPLSGFWRKFASFTEKKGLAGARMLITLLEDLDVAGSKFCWCWLHPPMFWRVPRERRGWPSPLHLSHCQSFPLGREEQEITIHGRELVSLKPGQCVLSSIKAHSIVHFVSYAHKYIILVSLLHPIKF